MSSGLPTKPVFVPLAVGLATETVEKLVQPGSVTRLENAHQDHTGQITKRTGSDVLSEANQATVPANGPLPDVWRLSTLNGNLVRFNVAPHPIHVWDDSGEVYIRPSPNTITAYRSGPMFVEADPIVAEVPGGEQVAVADSVVNDDVAVVCYEHTTDSGTFVRIVIVDLDTKVSLYVRTLSVGTKRPRPMIFTDRVAVAYNDAGTVKVDVIDLSLFTATTIVGSPCDADSVIDLRRGAFDADAQLSVLYQYLTAPGYTAARVSEIDVVGATVEDDYLVTTATAPVSGTAECDLALAWLEDGASVGSVGVIFGSTTYGLYVVNNLPAPSAGSSSGTLQVLDAGATAAPSGATAGIRNVTGTTILGATYRVLYEVTAPDLPTRAVIKAALWIGSASTQTAYQSVGLRSKLWKSGSDYYFLAGFAGPEQKTYFVMRLVNSSSLFTVYSTPHATAYVRSAGGLTEKVSHLPQVTTGPDGEFIVAATYETRTESTAPSDVADGDTEDVRAIGLLTVTLRTSPDTELGGAVPFAGQLFTPGGLLGSFDGRSYGLPGFANYPPETGSVVGGTGGLETDSDYAWRAVYAYVDHTGRKWRSAPSVPNLNATAGSDTAVTISCDTLRVVDRDHYQIECYRTRAGAPGAYFLVATIPNDPTQESLDILDKVADDDLGEELYTDGNTLENQLLPAISHVAEFQNRLVCAEAGTATLWYSLPSDLIHGLTFNEALTLDVGDPSDPITGLIAYGTRLIAFKERKLYIIFGDGANALNQGGTYTAEVGDPAVGCVNASSILATSQGVYFRGNSERIGFYRTAGGPAEYIGQGVRDFNDLTVTGAVVAHSRGELQWMTAEGRTMVYSLATQDWVTNTDQECLAATYYRGVTYANTDGQVIEPAAALYLEGEAPYNAVIRSPWLSFAGMKGWERIKRILLVGAKGGAHKCTVRLYRNFDGETPFASYERSFTGDEPWEFKVRPLIQKLTSLLVEIEIEPYQAPDIAIVPGSDTYDGLDVDTGQYWWTFENGDFSEADVGASVVIAGAGAKNGTYTIVAIVDSDTVAMTPAPGGGTGAFVATSITLTRAPEYTAGPGVTGMTLVVGIKQGAQKLPGSTTGTPT